MNHCFKFPSVMVLCENINVFEIEFGGLFFLKSENPLTSVSHCDGKDI